MTAWSKERERDESNRAMLIGQAVVSGVFGLLLGVGMISTHDYEAGIVIVTMAAAWIILCVVAIRQIDAKWREPEPAPPEDSVRQLREQYARGQIDVAELSERLAVAIRESQ